MTDARSKAEASPVFGQCERFVISGAGLAGRGFARAASGAVQIARGVITARRILADLSPSAMVGFGGYPAVAPVLAARLLRRRPVIVLHDQNAVLGRANRFLARFADRLALSFPDVEGVPAGLVTTVTGNPVRPAIAALRSAPYAAPVDRIRLLVLGGSLGARVFGTLLPDALAELPGELRDRIDLVMQCPAATIEGARVYLAELGIRAEIAPFFDDVEVHLAEAHLVIARAGGSTVAEIAVIGRPALFVPLAINADQRANADVLVRAGGAVRLDQAELTPDILTAQLHDLLTNPERLTAMAAAASGCGIADGVDRLAALVQSVSARRSAS